MSVMPLDFVEAPASTPPRYGILSAAVVVNDTDPHAGFGFEYQPDFCGPARMTPALCLPSAPPGGSVSASVAADRTVTLTVTGEAAGEYHIDWGDGASTTATDPGALTHTYPAGLATSYNVVVTGPDGYRATTRVNVTTGATSGPFTGTLETTKIAEVGRGLVEGEPFAVYSLSECQTVGLGDARSRAERSLTMGEGRAVEEWLGARLDAEADDLGDATAADPIVGLAVLEQHIHCNYGGRGTVHMNRGVASWLMSKGALETSADRLETGLGNTVSAGCYDNGATGPGDDQFMYATGTVLLQRGPIFSPPDPLLDQRTNVSYALAERPYAGSWECFAVKVLVGTGTP
jgi:hypothetical protein